MNKRYDEEFYKINTLKLRDQLKHLPHFCSDFFRAIEVNTSIRTRVAYAYDLAVFFDFLINNISVFKKITLTELPIEDLGNLEPIHIERFLEFLSYYKKTDSHETRQNMNSGKARKLAAIRTMLNYFFKRRLIKTNVAKLIDMPKITEKVITRLEVDEVADLLDCVENGKGLTENQKRFHKLTKRRDLALFALLLGTGIRVSECIGINISDLDLNVNGFRITRKGGSQAVLYFSEEVRNILLNYLNERKAVVTDNDALFLSLKKKRISQRMVQELVKKYARIITPLKNISPHKLRSTYGTNLYRETGDIYLVADVLGHKDVNTTKKHYAEISDDKRRQAARIVKLRD